MTDWRKLVREIERLIKLRTYPVAYKKLEDARSSQQNSESTALGSVLHLLPVGRLGEDEGLHVRGDSGRRYVSALCSDSWLSQYYRGIHR